MTRAGAVVGGWSGSMLPALAAEGAPVHWRALDGLRGLSAQIVFLGHVIAIAARGTALVSVAGWMARVAVIVFFVLSGFVIVSSIDRDRQGRGFDLRHFAIRRAARIYPPYLVALLIVGVVIYAANANMPPMPAPETMSTGLAAWARGLVLLYRGNDAPCVVDSPLWTLRLEVIAYAIAGLAVFALTIRGASTVLAVTCLAAALVLGALGMALIHNGFLALTWFAIGAAATRVGTGRNIARVGFAGTMFLVVIGVAAMIVDGDALGAAQTGATRAFQLVLAGFVALWIAALTQERTRGFAQLRACAPLARFAYTLYVVHVPLILFAAAVGARFEVSAPVVILSSVMAIELIAILLALVCERPDFFAARLDLAFRAGARAVGYRPRLG